MASADEGPSDPHSPYQGSLRRMVRDGYGHYIYPNTFFQYEGEWKNGKKHGHGKLLLKDGSYYKGEFVEGEIIGKGERYWASSGNTYYGQFVFGELQGRGTMKYKDGGKYEGEFSQGMREGYGSLTDENGQVYQGLFHKNKKHGSGQMIFKNGDKYDGDWILDQRQGHGVLYCADGSTYEGQWRNGVFNGQGLMIHSSGILYDGLWINGYPATRASKIVILGPEMVKMVQGSSIILRVQLQTDDGEVVESENGRILKIWAGVRYVQLPIFSDFSFFKVTGDAEVKRIETPFGFECISYPLMIPELESPARGASKCEFPEYTSYVPKEELEAESLLDILYNARSDSDDPDEEPHPTSDPESQSFSSPHYQRVNHGYAEFHEVSPAAPPPEYHPILFLGSISKEKDDQQPDDIEYSQKTDESSETISPSSLKSLALKDVPAINQTSSPADIQMAYPGEYVIIVEEATTPPFLGERLPPAFLHLKVLSMKK